MKSSSSSSANNSGGYIHDRKAIGPLTNARKDSVIARREDDYLYRKTNRVKNINKMTASNNNSGSNSNAYGYTHNNFNRPNTGGATSTVSGASSIQSSASARYFREQGTRNNSQSQFQFSKSSDMNEGNSNYSSRVSQLVKMHSNSSGTSNGTSNGSVNNKAKRWGAEPSSSSNGVMNTLSSSPKTTSTSPYSTSTLSSSTVSEPGILGTGLEVGQQQQEFTGVGVNSRRPKPFPESSPGPRSTVPPSTDTSTIASGRSSPKRNAIPYTKPSTSSGPSYLRNNSNHISSNNDRPLGVGTSSQHKPWINRQVDTNFQNKDVKKDTSLNSKFAGTASSKNSKSSDVSSKIKASNTIKRNDSSSATSSSFSGDCVNVWVRHSIISSILAPKPSFGTSSTPGRKLHKSNSIASDVNNSFNTSFNSSSLTPLKSIRGKLGSGVDDMSVASNATEGAKSVGTTSARWGWVKASLLNNDAFSSDPKKNCTQDHNALDESHSSSTNPPWQKQLKSKNGGSDNDKFNTKPQLQSDVINVNQQPRKQPEVVSVKIIDLESEYHGVTVDIPLSKIQNKSSSNASNATKCQDNNSNTAIESIFGDAIVMANQWPDFTSIPNESNTNSSSDNEKTITPSKKNVPNTPKWVSPRGFKSTLSSSSDKGRDKRNEQKEETETENVDDVVDIPKDLTNLTHLHEPAVVYCLRYRYAMNEIYTSTGPILLALNPFKDLKGIYSEDLMRRYCERGQKILNGSVPVKKKGNLPSSEVKELPPHVYAVADNAYRSMMRAMEDGSGDDEEAGPDQSILVSGESGAGKTVTTKIIMKYLAALSKRSSSKNDKISSSTSRWKSKSFQFSPSTTGTARSAASSAQSITPNGKRTTNIEQQVLESNPILESFGNARTIRNDNSSRFGKFIEIQFTGSGKLLGASIDSYLLEKVRLTKHADGERNYHIFYELLNGASGSERKQLLLGRTNPQDFAMTRSSSETYKRRDGVRDDTTFAALRKAMGTMGFKPDDQIDILQIVSAILHLSNLTFLEDSSGCTLDNKNASLTAVLQLLGVTRDNLDNALCCVNIEAGGEKLVKKLFYAQAIKAKEAMIKATYGALFDYLVRRINNCIHGGRRNSTDSVDGSEHNDEPSNPSSNQEACEAFIGVLDIFGFESFQQNSFEQLCINYCNESLQQQFNKFVFKLEQAEYEREGIQWNFIAFPDNQDVLDLIDKKRAGILSILDEQSFLSQCTDQSFAQSVYQQCGNGNNSPFVSSTRQMARGSFSIHHYAGPVEYDTSGFIEKNKDELPKEIDELLRSSENEFLQHLGEILNSVQNSTSENALENKSFRSSSKQSSLKRITVGGQFSSQLQELRKRIDTTSPHYIRCLKPNDALEPNNFDSAVIADQLRCAGILEAVRVSRVGYPQRYLHKTFVQRYQVLAMKELQIRRKDASTKFTTPSGFGFHGFVAKREKPSPTVTRAVNNSAPQKKLNSEQECKILINALAKQLVAAQKNPSSDEEEENIAPAQSHWTSPAKQMKKWPTPGSQLPSRPMKKEIDLVQIGIQFGKTKVFLRQHAFEALERMRGRTKSSAATVINSLIRMYLRRKRYIIMRNEYRARVAQRSRIIREGGFAHDHEYEPSETFNRSDPLEEPRFNFKEMHISLHREEDFGSKEFKWVWLDNRWVKNEEDEQ